jgi:hypothetical protein
MSMIGDIYEDENRRNLKRLRKLYKNGGSKDYLKGLEDAYEIFRTKTCEGRKTTNDDKDIDGKYRK